MLGRSILCSLEGLKKQNPHFNFTKFSPSFFSALNDEDDIIDEASAFSTAAAVAAAVASSASAVATSSSNSNNTKMLTRTQSISIDTELANEVFDHFMSQAATLKSILRTFRYLCDILRLKPQEWPHFYPKLKSKLTSWKANALWAKFDKRASHKVYMKGKACAGQRVLVIGAGPCGLRTAIECQLLGKLPRKKNSWKHSRIIEFKDPFL